MSGRREEGAGLGTFVGKIAYCELELAHAASARGLGEGIVAKHSGGWAALLGLPVLPVAVSSSGEEH